MIKAVVFDLDGTLIDAREWHFEALNEALSIFGEEISREEHENQFDGLPTKVKLQKLTSENRLPLIAHKIVSSVKQDRTIRLINSRCFPKIEHLLMVSSIKARGLKLGLATNSIRETAYAMLESSDLVSYFDIVLTNQDVRNSKPSPEIYKLAAEKFGISTGEILAFEDSDYGVTSAKVAGCEVRQIKGPWELNSNFINEILDAY